MPRCRETEGRVTRARRSSDNKPAALMDIVVGAVRRLETSMGVSIAEIQNCAVAEGDLPVRQGTRAILRLGLNRAVETGRLERLPGGLFRLPADGPGESIENQQAFENPSGDGAMATSSKDYEDADLEEMGVAGDMDAEECSEMDLEEAQLLPLSSDEPDQFVQSQQELQSIDNFTLDDLEEMDDVRRPSRTRHLKERADAARRERSAADHGRAACGALYKLSSDVIGIIAQTAAARLHSLNSDVAGADDPVTGGSRRQQQRCDSDKKDESGDTQRVVGATGQALSEIAIVANRGATRVLQVAAEIAAETTTSGSTSKEAIFRTFKDAAMEIVSAARAFGQALGETDIADDSDQQCSGRGVQPPDSDAGGFGGAGGDGDVFAAGVAPHEAIGFMPTDAIPDMEDFADCLLQTARVMTQDVVGFLNLL